MKQSKPSEKVKSSSKSKDLKNSKESKDSKVVKAPETLFQLLILMVKGFLKNIPKTLIRIGIIALLVFLLHTYLVIYPNGGFSSMGTRLSQLLELKKSKGVGTIIWTIMVASIMATIGLIRSQGIKTFLKGLVQIPVRVKDSISKVNGIIMGTLTVVVFLLEYFVIKNEVLGLVIGIAVLLSLAAYRYSFSYVVMRLSHSDIHRLIKKKKKFNDKIHVLMLFPLSIGSILYFVLPKTTLSLTIVVVLMIALIVATYLLGKNNTKAAMVLALVFFSSMSSYLIFGDDGGVKEAGGLWNWLTSEGAWTAVGLGIGPAIGAGIGGYLGTLLADLGITGLYDVATDPEVIIEAVSDLMEEAEDFGESVLETVDDLVDLYDSLTDPAILEETISDTYDEFTEMLNAAIDDPSLLWEAATETSHDVVELLNAIQDGIVTSDEAGWIADSLESILPNGNLADALFSLAGGVKDLGEGLGWLDSTHPLGQLFGNAGIVKDALDNIGLGDNAIYATIKSYATNQIKNLIYDTESIIFSSDGTNIVKMNSLTFMDLVSSVFLADSDAGGIISPGNTITGTTNYIFDRFADLYNGTNDVESRLDGGKYGGFYQTMDQAFEEAGNLIFDTQHTVSTIKDNYTIGQFYDDIRANNADLWRVQNNSYVTRAFDYLAEQPGTMPGGVNIFQVLNNRNACHFGQAVFDGLSYMAEGTTHLGNEAINLAGDVARTGDQYLSQAVDWTEGSMESASQWLSKLW